MAGNNKSRKLLVSILGLGLTSLVVDRLFLTEPLSGPQGALAAEADPGSEPRAGKPKPSGARNMVNIASQLDAASGDLSRRRRQDVFEAPPSWLSDLKALAEKRRKADEVKKVEKSEPAKASTKLELRLVGVVEQNDGVTGKKYAVAVIALTEGRKTRSAKVRQGGEVEGYRVVKVQPWIYEPKQDALVVLERNGEERTLKVSKSE